MRRNPCSIVRRSCTREERNDNRRNASKTFFRRRDLALEFVVLALFLFTLSRWDWRAPCDRVTSCMYFGATDCFEFLPDRDADRTRPTTLNNVFLKRRDLAELTFQRFSRFDWQMRGPLQSLVSARDRLWSFRYCGLHCVAAICVWLCVMSGKLWVLALGRVETCVYVYFYI